VSVRTEIPITADSRWWRFDGFARLSPAAWASTFPVQYVGVAAPEIALEFPDVRRYVRSACWPEDRALAPVRIAFPISFGATFMSHQGLREPRWPAFVAMFAAAGVYLALPEPLSLGPSWLLLAILFFC
jgi:hypothetical protein